MGLSGKRSRASLQNKLQDILLVGALVKQAVYDRPPGPTIVTTRSALLARRPQMITEVAGHAGLREHGAAILRAGVDLLLVSTGALAEPALLGACCDAAQVGGARMMIVPGAIGALDTLAAASLEGEVARVVHTMRKTPSALLPPEEASGLTVAQEVFRGSARQAALRFPTFLNIAATVALAGIGFDQTEVLVLADPAVEHSVHKVVVEGSFGRFHFEIAYAPGHVATLVAQSIVHTLISRQKPLIIG